MIITRDSAEAIQSGVLEWLVSNGQKPTVLLVSGGSAGKLFAKVWAHVPINIQQNYILSLVDERFGQVGHTDSNWKLLQDLGVDLSDQHAIPVLTGQGFTETANHWGSKLQSAIAETNRVIGFFGIGEDSHIAGIKPNSPAAFEIHNLTIAYKWDDYERLTVTPLLFQKLLSGIAYLQGPAKEAVVAQLADNLDIANYPSQLCKQVGDFTLYYQPE